MDPRQDRTASEGDLIVRLNLAEEALRARKLDFQLIVDSIPAQVAVVTPTGEVETLNQPCLEYFGKTLKELKGWASSDPVHPEDLPHVVEVLTQALETGEIYEVEARHRRYDGVYRWFHVRGFPLKDLDGRILRWCVLLTDIDDRKRAEAQLAGEKRLLEMVASGSALTDVLTELCIFVENTAADCKCGIYLIDWSGPTFHLGAAPSLPATFNHPVEGLTVSSDAGPCGSAALTKSQVIVTNIESDSRFQSATIRPLLLAHGICSHWSTPIFSRDGQVLGTFAVFQAAPSSPTQLQQDLIAQVTHIASIAIERTLSEEALKRSEGELKLTIDTMP
ncbi:MAG TPA: PAS domain S-box protein, partial [Pyrinomonadaceae bacterium]|nr:PAS domain S-box protein [Pyrinomonadaceae bacterium]